MSVLTPTTRQLVELMSTAPRGPRRDGLFALWLTVRVLEDYESPPSPNDRTARRRVALLERRLSSLTLAPVLRRGLGAAIAALKEDPRSDQAAGLLGQLAGPTREGLGTEAAEVLQRFARSRR